MVATPLAFFDWALRRMSHKNVSLFLERSPFTFYLYMYVYLHFICILFVSVLGRNVKLRSLVTLPFPFPQNDGIDDR